MIRRSLISLLISLPVFAAAPMVKTPAPGYSRFMLGAFEVTVISDGTIELPVNTLLKQPAAKTDAALAKAFSHSPLELSGNSYLINTGTKLILFDTGAGTLFGPTLGKLLTNLQSAGYTPAQVDEIFITHLHPDHVGGLMLDGKLAFPNATLHFSAKDAGYWLDEATMNAAPDKSFFQGAMASVNPWIKAGRTQPIDRDGEIVTGVTARASNGHTVGHTSYLVESGGQSLLIIGDLIHVPAVQLENPSIAIAYDTDEKSAVQSREKLFTWAAREGVLVAGAHLPFPGIGHLKANGRQWQWLPSGYTTQLH